MGYDSVGELVGREREDDGPADVVRKGDPESLEDEPVEGESCDEHDLSEVGLEVLVA